MRRWIVISVVSAVVAIAIAGLMVQQNASAGGAGCHSPVTDAAGDKVALQQNCMMPTILRADSGETITFTNSDEQLHSVTGASTSWGDFESLTQGQTIMQTFTNDGIYPYFCVLHPGMIGAIVVGDPAGSGAADLNGDNKLGMGSSAELVSSAPNAALKVASGTDDGGTVVSASILSGAVALVIGGAVTALLLRRRQTV